jgi:hypothetical protein
VRQWWHVVNRHDTEPTQLTIASLLLLWSILIALPVNAWAVAVTYRWLDEWSDPQVWVAISMTIAVLWLVGFFARLLRLRMWCAWGSLMFWTMLSVGSYISSPFTFGWIAYASFAVGSGWVFLRRGGG